MSVVYITTPIYYVNGAPHLGHLYTTVAADAFARWHRLAGNEVRFLTGTDEHGQKVEKSAREAGITPQAQADKNSALFRDLFVSLGISNDDFIRTTEERHKRVVTEVWQRMEANGDLYLGKYEGWYSQGDEAYFDESELVDGRAPSGHPVTWMVEESWFFRLSKYADRLKAHLEAHPEFLRPETRFNEVMRFIEQGLNDISVSRTNFTWGIPVPGQPGHVVYVWVDALTNYISALGGPGAPDFEKFWPKVVHFLGKDIIRFHAVFWPCFLMSAGLPLPERLFAHGWWTVDGQKMGKSFGNAIAPDRLAGLHGHDALRYFLLREGVFGSDCTYSDKAFADRVNGDLANDWGNLASRTLGMLAKYEGGVVPERGEADREDDGVRATYEGARANLIQAMDELAFQRALGAVWDLVHVANKYVDTTAPWVLARDPARKARLREVLYTLCEALRVVGIWSLPFLPEKAALLLDRLGIPADARTLAHTAAWGGLAPGTRTQPGDGLFPRIEKVVEPVVEAPKASAQKAPPPKTVTAPATAAPEGLVRFEDFARLTLKTARVLTAERHPNADRLLVLGLDAGEDAPRTVCAGIAQAYAPEALVGQTVVLLANLEPRKIRGIASNGMLLAAGEGETLRLVTVPGDLPPGTSIG